MEGLMKDIHYIRHIMSAKHTAADLWLIAICVVAAFGHTVPWYMWVIFGLEGVGTLLAISRARNLKGSR